jgi:hypothetical protein
MRTRQPTTLLARAEQLAIEQHQRRMAELRDLAPLLARLEELLPALAQRGLEVGVSDYSLKLDSHQPTGFMGKRLKVIRLHTRGLLANDARVMKWLDAFRELGFTEVERSNGVYPSALLRKGHLLVRVDVPESPKPPAPQDATTLP